MADIASTIQQAPPFPLAGEVASLSAALIWSGSMSIFTKYSADIPAQAINFFKNAIALGFLGLALVLTVPTWSADPATLALLAVSGVIGISLGDTALFAALKRLGAQITSSSQCLAPPIAALIAAVTLGERLTPQETAGLFVTVSGVSGIILLGRRRGAQLAGLTGATVLVGLGYALFSALCQGAGLVISRYAFQGVDVVSGTIVRIAPAALLLGGSMFLAGQARHLRFVVAEPRRAMLLGLAAFGGTFLGLLLMSAGVKYAKAGIAAALTSTYPIWIIPIAHFALKERVTLPTMLCTLVAVVGIVMMLV